MPNPGAYKSQKAFMSACMKETKSEGLTHSQCVGKCMGMWDSRGKKKGAKKK